MDEIKIIIEQMREKADLFENFSIFQRDHITANQLNEWADRLQSFLDDQDQCKVNILSSRMCEKGTKSCEVRHNKSNDVDNTKKEEKPEQHFSNPFHFNWRP